MYKDYINTAVGYFDHLGDSINEIRMKKQVKLFDATDLNKVFKGKLITESGYNAHKWVLAQLEEIEELAYEALFRYDKIWNNPIGNEIIVRYKEISEKMYKEHLGIKWYTYKQDKWLKLAEEAESRGTGDDEIYCRWRANVYGTAYSFKVPWYRILRDKGFNRWRPDFEFEIDNVNPELKKIKW